jgi:serine/threonine protein kinase
MVNPRRLSHRDFPSLPPKYCASDDAQKPYTATAEIWNYGPHSAFDPSEVKPWQPSRFDTVEKLQDAPRNAGEVFLMWDKVEYQYVAVKRMPNVWIQACHADFVAMHPDEFECPWQDIGFNKFLNCIGFQYGCSLLGVYRDKENTLVVTTYANKGDLFSWCDSSCNQSLQPGLEREAFIKPLVANLLLAVQQLHELSIVHRDISMENILLSEADDGRMLLQIIDFGMASCFRHFQGSVSGKPSYQAPELHQDGMYDAFLSDTFSVGVTIYAVCLQGVPWLSTKPGACKCFKFVQKHGFPAYVRKRKLHHTSKTVADHASDELLQLLGGLLELDPAKRLTLGESAWHGQRRSVWDEPWLRGSMDAQRYSPR